MSCPPTYDLIIDTVIGTNFPLVAAQLRRDVEAGRDFTEAVLEVLARIDAIMYEDPVDGAIKLRILDALSVHAR